MYALGRELVGRMGAVLASSYYTEQLRYLKEIFVVSRSKDHRDSPTSLLSIQLTIAEYQSGMYKALREGRALAKDIKNSKDAVKLKDLEGIEKNILIHEQLLRISKSIADGIAWRILNYDRMIMDVASRGFGTGAIDVSKPDFQSEFTWAYILAEKFKGKILVNDLTHSLKVGDLTEIEGSEILVHEIKKLGKKVNNVFTLTNIHAKAELSKQSKKLLEFQKLAVTKKIDIDGKTVTSIPVRVRLKTHFKKVEWLIKDAYAKGHSEIELEPYLLVKATSFHKSELLPKNQKRQSSDGNFIIQSNWDSYYTDELGNFMRLILPYSIYPFKNSVCMDLMSGHLLLVSELNLDRLKASFINKGWKIEETKEEDLDKSLKEIEEMKSQMYSGEKLFSYVMPDIPFFTLRRGSFAFQIDSLMGVRTTYEYMTFETLNEVVETAFERASQIRKPEAYYPQFIGEKKLWN